MMGMIRLTYRTVFTVLCMLTIICLMAATSAIRARHATRAIMRAAFRAGAWVYGIRVRMEGALAANRPLIVVSNHFSYLDLFVLGSRIPAAFTPKREIGSWPLVGIMCKVAGCVFIDRRRTRTANNRDNLLRALKQGDIISLFPEGTTNEGTGLLPFKSALFGIAKETRTPVQPLSIIYTRLNEKPLDAAGLATVGWYGDSHFFPHIIRYLQQRSLEATLVFHPIVDANDFPSRKALADFCQQTVEKGIKEWRGAPEKKRLRNESEGAKPNNGG